MSSSYTIQLPAGSNITKLVNVPTGGAWLGGVNISIATHTTDATIHEWIFINEVMPSQPTKIGYRHVDVLGVSAGGFDNWTLKKETRPYKVLFIGESLMKLRYTSTYEISVNIETSNTQWKSNKYPTIQGNLPHVYDGRIVWVNK
jgi:hypothetical protein